MLRFVQVGEESSNFTRAYKLILDKEYTVGDFIYAVRSRQDEWGYIRIDDEKYPFGKPFCEYARGKVINSTDSFSEEFLSKKVISANAHGGWGLMNYTLVVEENAVLKIPKINWIPFDKNNPPKYLLPESQYLIVLREDDFDNGATWSYSIDYSRPSADCYDPDSAGNFWEIVNDWNEGQRVEVVAYAEFPYVTDESELVEVEANA